jgi:hypothetical protein
MKKLEYGAFTSKNVLEEAKEWCEARWGARWEAIGNREGSWCVFWAGPGYIKYGQGQYQWWFETEEQRLLFALRWS